MYDPSVLLCPSNGTGLAKSLKLLLNLFDEAQLKSQILQLIFDNPEKMKKYLHVNSCFR